jgi:DNA-binding GntR family transcriptional regulator
MRAGIMNSMSAPSQPHPERVSPTRTVAEQIADHLGMAIVNGEFRGGDRLLEQDLAARFDVSRGPVREAIRELERRGLVEFFPRRGAYVLDLTLDTIADAFNIRAVLMGLAARGMSEFRNEGGIAALRRAIDEADRLAQLEEADPAAFGSTIWRAATAIITHCGNPQLTKTLREQNRHSLWGLIWLRRPLEFTTQERRLEVAAAWRALYERIAAGESRAAEELQRRIHFGHRDRALAALQQLQENAPQIDQRRLIFDK